jgi:hypothetical protein
VDVSVLSSEAEQRGLLCRNCQAPVSSEREVPTPCSTKKPALRRNIPILKNFLNKITKRSTRASHELLQAKLASQVKISTGFFCALSRAQISTLVKRWKFWVQEKRNGISIRNGIFSIFYGILFSYLQHYSRVKTNGSSAMAVLSSRSRGHISLIG